MRMSQLITTSPTLYLHDGVAVVAGCSKTVAVSIAIGLTIRLDTEVAAAMAISRTAHLTGHLKTHWHS